MKLIVLNGLYLKTNIYDEVITEKTSSSIKRSDLCH